MYYFHIVTKLYVKILINSFSGYVMSRNIAEYKKIIQGFVKEVIVYKEHIEVTFNVSFNLLKNAGRVEVFE